MTFSTLINAASLKGYLRASNAKIEAIRWAEEIISVESARLAESPREIAPAFVANEDVRLPEPPAGRLGPIKEPETPAANTPAVFPLETPSEEGDNLAPVKTVIAAPETGLTEENAIPSAGEGAPEGNDARVKGTPRKGRGGRAWTDEDRAAASRRALEHSHRKAPLVADSDLESVKQRWGANESFDSIGKSYGCSGSHVRNFLTKHGIDPRRSALESRARGRPALSEEQIQLIIDEKAKGTSSREIGEMIDRSPHAVDQKYSDLKKSGRVPPEHVTPEALKEKKSQQNAVVSSKMKEFHATRKSASEYIGQREPQKEAVWYPDDWGDIETMLNGGTPIGTIARDYGVTVPQLQEFITQNRKKDTGHANPDLDEEGWPVAAKPEKKMDLAPAPARQEDQPRMKYKMVKIKDSWGNNNEIQVAEPLSVETDPETGAKVTKYPPGYALGTGPQRNISVKGGA